MPRTYVQNVEFGKIKESLKEFLRDPDNGYDFTDYDFEGSNLSVIINLLAYTAHYHAMYSNFVLNEAFLRSARTRPSIVSRAKELGYTPGSRISPTLIVDFTMKNISGTPNFYTLPRGTKFKAKSDGREFTFVVTEDVTAEHNNGEYVFDYLVLREGKILSTKRNVTQSNVDEPFEIPDEKVDKDLLKVRVKESSESSEENSFQRISTIADVDRNTRGYWIQENPNGKFEVEFGDGVVSKNLKEGNIIKMNWLSTNGPDANGIKTVTPDFNIAGGYDYEINVTAPAFGGRDKETNKSVKFTAPKSFAKQNRVVTIDDFYSEIIENVGGIRDLKVWGGEDNDPPRYGIVFISIETNNQYFTRTMAKNVRENVLKNKMDVGTITEFVSPVYINPNVKVNAVYDASKTLKRRETIQESIENITTEFINDKVRQFNARFFVSQLEREIMDIEYVESVTTAISLSKETSVPFQVGFVQEHKFDNPIEEGTVTSNYFTAITGFMEFDAKLIDKDGELFLHNIENNEEYFRKTGTVDYEKGVVTINNLTIKKILKGENNLIITVDPSDERDLSVRREKIFTLGNYEKSTSKNIPAPIEVDLSTVRS